MQVSKKSPDKSAEQPFLTDVEELRSRARKHLEEGAVTKNYGADIESTIAILQNVVATELVCYLRYTMHAIVGKGISSDSVRNQFKEHAETEERHMMVAAERINQLGGSPNFSPEGLFSRSATEYIEGKNLIEMIKENLIAERIVIEHYLELIRFFGDKDPTTRIMLEKFLREEENHADEMHDLLVAHEGHPMLQ